MTKIAILANQEHSFVLPMAQGLQSMLTALGVRGDIFYRGLQMLWKPPAAPRLLSRKIAWLLERAARYRQLCALRQYDAIVVVMNLPRSFSKRLQVEWLRGWLPKTPILSYDVHYLPTCGWWERKLLDGSPADGILAEDYVGLERYDWYLSVSVGGFRPFPKEPQPVSEIGIALDERRLFPEQGDDFTVLLDFERPNYMKERAVQLQALEETGTRYLVLNGDYALDDIYRVYRRCHLYCLASLESFGLPICELQACGAAIATPYADWIPGHWIKADPTAPVAGTLSPNFFVYHNDRHALVELLTRMKREHDAAAVRRNLLTHQPHFLRGDAKQLDAVLDGLRRGTITASSHLNYHRLRGVDLTCARCGIRLDSLSMTKFSPQAMCAACFAEVTIPR